MPLLAVPGRTSTRGKGGQDVRYSGDVAIFRVGVLRAVFFGADISEGFWTLAAKTVYYMGRVA